MTTDGIHHEEQPFPTPTCETCSGWSARGRSPAVPGARSPSNGWTAGITSRSYDTAGDTPDDVYGLSGDVLTIWDGERGSPVLRSLTKACT
jgi:hypothetical protein